MPILRTAALTDVNSAYGIWQGHWETLIPFGSNANHLLMKSRNFWENGT